MFKKKLLPLLLVLCLAAGCAATPESPAPPPTESVGQSAPESQPEPPAEPSSGEAEPAPEEPELPDALAGADGYYTPGHRLTLYAMEPGSGTIRTVREAEFWNGREVESVSPSGDRVLLSSWDGAPSRRVVALSLYDIKEDRLVNLERTMEGPYGSWKDAHWFPGYGSCTYRFVNENTFLYQDICDEETPGKEHLHLYDIGADGKVTARFLELASPVGEQEGSWSASCIWWAEENAVLGYIYKTEEDQEWVTWDVETGKLLARWPGKNGGIPIAATPYLIRNGVMYYTEDDWDQDNFQLMAYDIHKDELTVLASGPLVLTGDPVPPGEEKGRGYFEETWLAEITEDGSFVIRSTVEHRYGVQTEATYREAVWSPATGGTIQLGEVEAAPAFPVDSLRGYTPVFAAMPDGSGGYVPLPQEMAAVYTFDGKRPYPIAVLPGGELLFLAKEPLACLPQEDPENPGALAGAEGNTGGHRLSLYRFSPESGRTELVQEPCFWNGLVPEAVSPSGDRVLLSTRDEGGRAALSVYDIRENRLYNLTYTARYGADSWREHWFPGEYRYCFGDEDVILYQEYRHAYLSYYSFGEGGGTGESRQNLEVPEIEAKEPLPCVYLPKEKTLACLLTGQDGSQTWATWSIDVKRDAYYGYRSKLLAQVPAENASYPLEGARPPEGPPADLPLPEGIKDGWPVVALSAGEILFLAR